MFKLQTDGSRCPSWYLFVCVLCIPRWSRVSKQSTSIALYIDLRMSHKFIRHRYKLYVRNDGFGVQPELVFAHLDSLKRESAIGVVLLLFVML